jgi:hypothetical protein
MEQKRGQQDQQIIYRWYLFLFSKVNVILLEIQYLNSQWCFLLNRCNCTHLVVSNKMSEIECQNHLYKAELNKSMS